MEKTKKLFTYAVVFVAVVALFIAGITVQSTPSYAIDAVSSITAKPAPSVEEATITVDGVTSVVDPGAYFIRTYDEDRENNERLDQHLAEAKSTAENDEELQTQIDKLAKDIDPDYDHNVMVVNNIFNITFTGQLKERLEQGAKLKMTFKALADIVLFKSSNPGAKWEVLEILANKTGSQPANAAGIYAAGEAETTVMIPGDGTIVFETLSKEKAAEAKAKAANKGEKCCEDCHNCPFCSFLCKDGKCYCWSMYVVIVLAAILLILLIALIIVKAKANKPVDVQAEAPADAEEELPQAQQEEQNENENENR